MNETPDVQDSLPKALWLGTAVFFLIGALVLLFILREGGEISEAESTAKIEGQPVTLNAEQLKRLRYESAPSGAQRRKR